MAANLNSGLQRGLRFSIMRSITDDLLPYVLVGYWLDGYTRKD